MSGKVELSVEDRSRLTRLHEEVVGRLHEMAAITARNLQIDLDGGYRVLFKPEPSVHDKGSKLPADSSSARFEIVCSSNGECGYYWPEKGICEVCDEL